MNPRTPILVLMGLRGSGKSTLARTIGAQLGVEHADLDERVLALMEAETVTDAWARDGEGAFRAAETRALRAALDKDGPMVLALGGGTPTAPGAADVLRDATAEGRCTLVYLRLAPEQLRDRMRAHDPDRPALTGTDALTEIDGVFAMRDPLYRALAMHEFTPETGTEADAYTVLALWVR